MSDTIGPRTEPRCKICNSIYRAEIEEMIIKNVPYREICDWAKRQDPPFDINPVNIHNHKYGGGSPHFDYLSAGMKIAQEKAKELYKGAAQDSALSMLFLREVLEKALLQLGNEKINPKLGIRAAGVLANIRKMSLPEEIIPQSVAEAILKEICEEDPLVAKKVKNKLKEKIDEIQTSNS